MSERVGTIKSHIEGPRWARSDQAIKNACWNAGMKCTVERETTLLREIVRFEVEGTESQLRSFKIGLENAIKEWNT